ncbi:hypothetical protein, partial [Marinobacter salsuginis]|uniref:hypothetical protein n=1 Tax=Marinobacter salsuginis TaxID=418719 RepID=UPI00273EE861
MEKATRFAQTSFSGEKSTCHPAPTCNTGSPVQRRFIFFSLQKYRCCPSVGGGGIFSDREK